MMDYHRRDKLLVHGINQYKENYLCRMKYNIAHSWKCKFHPNAVKNNVSN